MHLKIPTTTYDSDSENGRPFLPVNMHRFPLQKYKKSNYSVEGLGPVS